MAGSIVNGSITVNVISIHLLSLVVFFIIISPQIAAPLTTRLLNRTVHRSTTSHGAARWATSTWVAFVIWRICTIIPSGVIGGIVVAHGHIAWAVATAIRAAALRTSGLVA